MLPARGGFSRISCSGGTKEADENDERMPSAIMERKGQLPITLHRQIAVLETHLGRVGSSDLYRGRIHNAPALIGELMVAGETDPGFFGLPFKFTMGQGPVGEAQEVDEIRRKAD